MDMLRKTGVTVEVSAGAEISGAVAEAFVMSVELGVPVTFEFNGTPMHIDAARFIRQIVASYSNQRGHGGDA